MHESPPSDQITITANGTAHTMQQGSTVADLLQKYHVNALRVVVQMDGVIVPRSALDKTVLQDGSKLEIVTMVGGG
jgi:sulfur carrier protein